MNTAVFPRTPPGGKVFRPQAARVFGWAWIVFAAANMVDIAWRGRDVGSLIAGTVMVLGCGIAYAAGLRPRIVADEDGVRLHNLVRDVRVPWSDVERIEGGDAVYVHSGGRRFRAFVLQTSARARARMAVRARREDTKLPDAVAEYLKNRTPTDFAVEQLRELTPERARNEGDDAARATVTWAWPPIFALLAPAAAFAAAIVIALA